VFFQPASVQQVAALPFVPLGDRFAVLLVTSRKGGRWLLPKGWPLKQSVPLAEAASGEAAEEAGVTGDLHEAPLGSYSYAKAMPEGYRVRCHVFVFPLLVRQHRLDWPERGQRSLRWSGLAEAAQLVEDRGLAKLLGDLARADGAPLHAAMRALRADEAAGVAGAGTAAISPAS